MSGPDRGSNCACTSARLLAILSFSIPQRPLGSAAVTAMPAIITLSRRSFHSSGVKFDLSVIGVNPPLARHTAEGRKEATRGAVYASPFRSPCTVIAALGCTVALILNQKIILIQILRRASTLNAL